MNARRSIILGVVLVIVIVAVLLIIQAQRYAASYADTVVQTYQVERAATEGAALATLQAERALTTSP